MSRLQMMALLLRVAGLYWIVSNWETTVLLSFNYMTSANPVPLLALCFFLLSVLVKFGIAGFFCLKPLSVVRFLTPGEVDESEEGRGLSASDIQSILFVVLGLYFAILAFLSISGPLVSMVLFGVEYSNFSDPYHVLKFYISPIIQFAIGVWLILGAKGFMQTVRRLRETGAD